MTHIRHRRQPTFTLRYRFNSGPRRRTCKERRLASEEHRRRLRRPYRAPRRYPKWTRARNGWVLVHYFESGYAWVGHSVKVHAWRKDMPGAWIMWPDLPAEQQAPYIAKLVAEREGRQAEVLAHPPALAGSFVDGVFPVIRAQFKSNPTNDLVAVTPMRAPRQRNARSRYSNAHA